MASQNIMTADDSLSCSFVKILWEGPKQGTHQRNDFISNPIFQNATRFVVSVDKDILLATLTAQTTIKGSIYC